jgi:PAS domain S-box-containing protein/hemerythrin-like metal-binding protein
MTITTSITITANNPGRLRSLLPLLIVFLWMSLHCASSRAETNSNQKVLVLHSYHQGYLWTDMIQEGFSRSLSEQFPKAEIYVEYMNTKRQTADVMFPHLAKIYKQLYPNVKFDVIIASDNNALDFLLLHREKLFPGVPVVFCGINDFFKYKFDPDSNTTGVREDLDVFSTISIALKLHPATKKVALITDGTETGQINLDLARSVAGKFPDITFVELNKLTAAQLSDSLKQLKDDTIVLALSFFRDQAGRTFTARESMDFIASASPRPVYTVWDFYMAPGTVGGKLLSGRFQGESAATLASSILRGKKAGSLPIVESPTAYMFGYAGLQKFSISESQLPTGAIVTGRPETFYTRYKYQLWSGIAIFTLQAMLIAYLLSNIARRRRGESALREQEVLYRAVADNGHALIWMAGLDKGCYYFNRPWLAFTGRTLEQESGTGWAEGVHPKDLQRCMDIYVAAFDKREAFSMTYRLHRHDGDYRWLLDVGTPHYDSAGLFVGYVGDCLDVTEHKLAQDALKKSEAFSLSIMDSMAAEIAAIDREGVILAVNKRWNDFAVENSVDVGGALAHTDVGANYLSVCQSVSGIDSDAALEARNGIRAVLDGRLPIFSLHYPCHSPMQQRWFVMRVTPFGFGEQAGAVVTHVDITDHKQAEDALRESEALFRAVSESAHDAIVTADASGNIIKWNPSAGQLFGYSENEAIGQSLTCLMPGRFRDRHVEGMSRVIAGGQPRVMGNPIELVGLRRDGSEFPLELSLARWQIADGNFFTGVIRDITERKKTERQLENQREHLEEEVETRTTELSQALEVAKLADQTKDAFLANMSHELRTPLSAVIGMANLARGVSTDPRLRDYLEKIVSSGQHLNSIINELLDLSKIAAGHMELENISFSLRTVIAHVKSVMSHRAAEKSLAIVTVIGDAVPDVLLGDPTRVAQIFLNLIGNAIKFTEAGQVTVRVGLRAGVENLVCLDIDFEDTGIGMRAEELKQLFKPFSQADASVSRRFGGTGLGLTISRRLAEMMAGDISVTSIEGSGTTFKVRICLGRGNAADLLPAEPAADEVLLMHYQDARILVADDQPLNREIVEALLLAVGITPRLAENGQEVLDILAESEPDAFDLVLMDIQMPVMDGHAATRAVRRRSGFEKLPIIAMTAHTMAHEKEINAAAGMNDHIGKPFDNASFYRTLAKWIGKAKQKTTDASTALGGLREPLAEAEAPAAQPGTARDHLRGVDWANGLARFNGKEDRYRHWLADFVESAGELPGRIRCDLAAGQPEFAARAVHAFKGRVGMLGMDDLHGVVSALEHALRDDTPTEVLLGSLEQSIGEVRNELTQFFARDDVPGRPAVLEKMVWDDAYSVGVAAMDDQHKKLFGMINQLADCHAAHNCESSGVFHEVLSRMFDYTQLHLKDEEAYLQRIGYPKLASHEGEHATFVEKITSFSIAAEAGVQDEAAVHRYLKMWLRSHILESDMQYRDFVKSNPPKR